ncbi:WecB/TagA/CpsF family glycosyltransferase [Enterovirga aerilata]|uniref:WecB/TagA/CpsF family glycosyltransferase n=1 Tax=Enterovirga aerilata TaxID=2730920 RepID=UPI001AEE5F50
MTSLDIRPAGPEVGLDLFDKLSVVETERELDSLVSDLLDRKRAVVLSFLNQHAFNLAMRDAPFRRALLESDILLRDGVGIEVALKLLGRPAGLNSNGTDLIPLILEKARGRRVAIFGTREPWLGAAADRIGRLGAEIVSCRDGFQPEASYLDQVRATRPSIVLLAMGMPRQESLAALIRSEAEEPCLIINGGAILDFMANRFRRAPTWMQAARIEWIFRMAQEPERLMRRYLSGGPPFAMKVLRLAWHQRARRALASGDP